MNNNYSAKPRTQLRNLIIHERIKAMRKADVLFSFGKC